MQSFQIDRYYDEIGNPCVELSVVACDNRWNLVLHKNVDVPSRYYQDIIKINRCSPLSSHWHANHHFSSKTFANNS